MFWSLTKAVITTLRGSVLFEMCGIGMRLMCVSIALRIGNHLRHQIKLVIMWIARDKDGRLFLFTFVKPVRKDEEGSWVKDEHCSELELAGSIRLDDNLFPQLTWDDEPMEVGLFPISADTDEELPTTIRLTTYY